MNILIRIEVLTREDAQEALPECSWNAFYVKSERAMINVLQHNAIKAIVIIDSSNVLESIRALETYAPLEVPLVVCSNKQLSKLTERALLNSDRPFHLIDSGRPGYLVKSELRSILGEVIHSESVMSCRPATVS